MIAGCHAESKALLMSRYLAAHTFRSSKADSVKEMREWAADSVNLPSRKPGSGGYRNNVIESGYQNNVVFPSLLSPLA